MNSIVKEITQTISNETPIGVSTIYFGGGTPSLLTSVDLRKILEAVHQVFRVETNAEVTLEANPDDISRMKLKQWRDLGINRLSVGIQSFYEPELEWMNRAHSDKDAIRCLNEIREADFVNYSADLIYGSPLLTNDLLKKNVEIIAEYEVPHLSLYALTVEKNTVLSYLVEKKKNVSIDDERQSEQFLWIMNELPQLGYEQYEISNFAKPGFRSRHNSSYWSGESYYGFGPSAHSFDGKNTRRWNVSNNNLYISALRNNLSCFEEEKLTPVQQANEYIMIGLRTHEGIDLEKISALFGESFSKQFFFNAKKHIDSGKLLYNEPNLKLSKEGKLFADGIASDLFV